MGGRFQLLNPPLRGLQAFEHVGLGEPRDFLRVSRTADGDQTKEQQDGDVSTFHIYLSIYLAVVEGLPFGPIKVVERIGSLFLKVSSEAMCRIIKLDLRWMVE